MRGGVASGAHGDGGRRKTIPERGGVRCDFVGARRIGDSVVAIDERFTSGVAESIEP